MLSDLAAGLSMSLSLFVQVSFMHWFPTRRRDGCFPRLAIPWAFLSWCFAWTTAALYRNTLTPMLPLLHNRDVGTLLNVLRLRGLVLASNIAGTWAVGDVLAHTSIFEPRVVDSFVELSGHTIGGTFADTFVGAVFAGWIIALMMWLLPAVKGFRAQIIVVMTYVVALGEFAHIVAGSVECAFLVQSGQASLSQYASDFFLPTLLGNIVGGTTLVALLNYGQVAAELDQSTAPVAGHLD